jgi:uncharacterized protein with ParB-like and HNH nuclease domain
MPAHNLPELFSQRVFRVPDYQRGYSWGEKQLSELWDDLDEIADTGIQLKPHYTGTIYLEEKPRSEQESWVSGVKFFDVVDGQQRLTTICILLFELIKVSNGGYCEESKEDLLKTFVARSNTTGKSRVYKFSYHNTNPSQNFFLHFILEDGAIVLEHDHRTVYTTNLLNAKRFFQTRIASLTHDERELLYRKLTTSLQFDIRMIEKDLDVQAVFETMNNRGKPLSTLEKLKNRLIYLAERLAIEAEDKKGLRDSINVAWGKIYYWLGKNPNQTLDEDSFLSAHLSLYRKPKDSVFSEKSAEEKLFQMFCNSAEKYYLDENENGSKEIPVDFNKILAYVLMLSELAPVWYSIHNTDSRSITRILILNRSKEIKILLAAILNSDSNDETKLQIVDNLEKVLFKNSVPGISIINDRTFATWARELYSNEKRIEIIIKETERLIFSSVNKLPVINAFKYLFTYIYGGKGFHRWSTLKYFLFEYEDALKIAARESNSKVTLEHFNDTTIEHIIPQGYWNHWAEEVHAVTGSLSANDKIAQTQKVFLNTLGNLTILKNGKNSSLGNRSWKDKRERFRTGSYNEIAISKQEKWNRSSISERGKEMFQFLLTKVPGLILSDEDIREILYFNEEISNLINHNHTIETKELANSPIF